MIALTTQTAVPALRPARGKGAAPNPLRDHHKATPATTGLHPHHAAPERPARAEVAG